MKKSKEDLNIISKPKVAYLLSEFFDIKYKKYEPRSDDINGEVVRDCAVRAFCKLLDKSWTEIFHEYYVIGLSVGEFGNSKECIEKLAIKYDYIVDKRFRDTRTIVAMYIYNNPTGKYIIGVDGHIFCVENKVVYDHFKSINESLYKSANDITNLEALLSAPIRFIIRKADEYNPLKYPKELQTKKKNER